MAKRIKTQSGCEEIPGESTRRFLIDNAVGKSALVAAPLKLGRFAIAVLVLHVGVMVVPTLGRFFIEPCKVMARRCRR